MKTTITFLFISLLSLQTFAADLIVRDGGAGGAYATITDAVNAATDGDRIIIRPKVGDVPYIENLIIDKSLTLLSEINGDNYEISGTITINIDLNRTVNIHNAFTTGNISLNGTISGGRAFINVIDSKSNGSLFLSQDNVTVNVVRTTSNTIRFRHGKVIANTCRRIYLDNDLGDSSSSDDVYIIANNINATANGSQQPPTINVDSSNYTFHVLNNRIVNASGSGININVIKEGTTNFLTNNFISPNFSNFTAGIIIEALASATIVIRNNLFDISDNIEANTNNAYIIAQYNMTMFGEFETFNVDVDENNIVNANFDSTLFTGDNENAGHPDPAFTDIDLTRNDIGPKGGSYSWDNFWTGEDAKPHVFFLQTPRSIFNGTTTFNANGTATTK